MRLSKLHLATLLFSACFINSCSNKQAISGDNQQADSIRNEMGRTMEKVNQLQANKKMVADFYQQLFGDKDTSSIDTYIAEDYIQHNPALPDGKDALKKAVRIWFKGAIKEKIDIQHLAADGDLVFIHTRRPGEKAVSIIDIFRLKDGKIVEHWDVIQEVPAKSANPHPMF